MENLKIAFSRRFQECHGVRLLKALPNFGDYSLEEQQWIRQAAKIYYPTKLFVDLFITMGKDIFPSRETYVYSGDKIKQTALFQFLQVPHPRTKVYFGKQKGDILKEFSLPFIAKVPRGSSMGRGVFLIRSPEELDRYLHHSRVAYIQEYLPLDRDIRVILIKHRVILAYWKVAKTGDFRSNLAQGARIDFEDIPQGALAFAQGITRLCNFEDVGFDLCHTPEKGWMVLEANMNYGRQALHERGLTIRQVLRDLVEEGII
jgi:ribosomal protein S6--L-glutamate ligase